MTTSKDPFYEQPLPKTFYHPSPLRDLSLQQKQVHLSPSRLRAADRDGDLHAGDKDFLKGMPRFGKLSQLPSVGELDASPEKFDESWPASERPSTISIIDPDDLGSPVVSGSRRVPGGALAESSSEPRSSSPITVLGSFRSRLNIDRYQDGNGPDEKAAAKDGAPGRGTSTLSKYIERFRSGMPQSRADREHKRATDPKDFWWLRKRDPDESSGSASTHGRNLTKGSLQDHDRLQQGDEETEKLQQRAEKLLAKSESSLNSSEPIVSTDGLLSSNTSGGSYFSEDPVRPGFTRVRDEGLDERGVRLQRPLGDSGDDILQQWRMRRKLEAIRAKGSGGMTLPRSTGLSGKVTEANVDVRLAEFRRQLARGLGQGLGQSVGQGPRLGQSVEQGPGLGPTAYPGRHEGEPPTRTAVARPTRPRQGVGPSVCGEGCSAADTTLSDPVYQPLHHSQAPLSPPCFHHPSATPGVTGGPSLTQDFEGVKPHSHLSCDILPCPEHGRGGRQPEGSGGGRQPEGGGGGRPIKGERPAEGRGGGRSAEGGGGGRPAEGRGCGGSVKDVKSAAPDLTSLSGDPPTGETHAPLKGKDCAAGSARPPGRSNRDPSRSTQGSERRSREPAAVERAQGTSLSGRGELVTQAEDEEDESFELMKAKHLRNIREEQLSSVEDNNDPDLEARPDSERLADADRGGHEPQVIPERDYPHDSDASDVTAKQNGRRSRHKSKVKGQMQSDIPAHKDKWPSKKRGSKVKPPVPSDALSDDQMTFTEVSDLEDIPRPEVAFGVKRSTRDKPSSGAASGLRGTVRTSLPDHPPPRPLRHTLPSPQHASSPVRPLSSTIGEVVGAHLFTSSLDTTDDGQCTERPAEGTTSQAAASAEEPRSGYKTGHADLDDLRFNEDDAVDLSDEDEFPEDEILRDLRQRRASHLERLLAIDRLLGGAADNAAK